MKPTDLLTAMKRTIEQIAAFNEIAKALTSTLELRTVLELVMQKISELLRPSNWSLLLVDEKTGELYFEIAVGPGAERLKGLRIRPGEGIAGAVFLSGEPRRVEHARTDPRFAERFDEATAFHTESLLAVPLRSRGKPLGVIELVNGPDAPAFTEDDLQAVQAVADFAGIAIDNARNFQRVQELTITDEHTGLYNARHLRAQLEQESARAVRFGHPLSLLFLDLDRFKEVNDTHGHVAGSALLLEVGELLRESIRGVDSAFRFGGDEFAVLLIETNEPQALEVAQRICDGFRQRRFLTARGLSISLTASIGLACVPTHASHGSELLEAADRAMYAAKSAGRNGIRVALRLP